MFYFCTKYAHKVYLMNIISLCSRALLLAAMLCASLCVFADRQPPKHLTKDSLTIHTSKAWKELPSTRMLQSGYPVELKVKGHSLCVVSKHEQLLPIYTKNGTLYLTMQLNAGVNWLNGLPCGRYQINNKTVNIK